MNDSIIGILGPTASGKTKLAAELAYELDAEIISMDSRQVYKELNLGVGKDLSEYEVKGKSIPYHLIDRLSLNEQYHLHQFKLDFQDAYTSIRNKNKISIACGGTGLYFDVLLNHRPYTQVPIDVDLRNRLDLLSSEELIQKLMLIDPNHAFDTSTRKRLIRAIEIANSINYFELKNATSSNYKIRLYGIQIDKKKLNEKIDQRLNVRMNEGLIEEVESLLKMGFSIDRLMYLGLEYKFVSMYLNGAFDKNEMFEKLRVAIHQYAKRQMTFFRKLEKDGHEIQWGTTSELKEYILKVYRQA